MEKVTEETICIPGKFYLVPCGIIKSAHYPYATFIIPIFGKPHADPQLGFEEKHYHQDCRFTLEAKSNKIYISQFDSSGLYYVSEIIYKKMKCRRATSGLNIPDNHKNEKYKAWVATMIGKSCAGKKCPHIGTVMRLENGKLVCPLHNLVGDPETEKIIGYQ